MIPNLPLSKISRNIIIFITICFVLITIIKSFHLSQKYGVVDLRTRVVGTRLMSAGHSPYFYKWNPVDGEFYLDPVDEAGRIVNGNVVTPATMKVMYPLSRLPYLSIIWIWTCLQLLAGFIIIFLLFKSNTLSQTIVQSALIVLGFICSDYWFYNIETGQIYIFYVLIFAIMYWCYTAKWKYHEFISGFIGGLFVFFRPFAAVIGVGFLLHGKTRWIIGCAAGFFIGFIVFILPDISHWKQYFPAMQEYINEELGKAHIHPNAIEPVKPTIIEGTDKLLVYKKLGLGRLDNAYHSLLRFGVRITQQQCLLLYAFLLAILSAFFFGMRKRISSPSSLFLFGFLAYILAELCTPAPRQVYNVIQWIFPISLIYLQARFSVPILIMLITAILLLHGFPFAFDQQGKMAESAFFILTVYTIFSSHLSKKV